MANLNSEIKKILSDIDNNVKDKETLEYVKMQIFNLYNILFDEVSNLEELANSRIAELAQNQMILQEKIEEMSRGLKNIEEDIYGDDEDEEEYDLSITCPYCNNDFVLELEEIKEEVTCPECNNLIELEWSHECDGTCDCCDDDCGEDCDCCHSSIDEDEDM